MTEITENTTDAQRQVDRLVRPTFAEWMNEMRIHMTPKETIDAIYAARRRGQTLEKFLGYPWA